VLIQGTEDGIGIRLEQISRGVFQVNAGSLFPAFRRLERAGVAAHEAVYVGDLYSIDVLGSRAAGLGAILLDPRGLWGPRDCHTARDLPEAMDLILGRNGTE